MKLLYLECNMGAAGDMLMGALADLLPDKQSFADRMNRLGIPGVHVELQNAVKCGIVGTHAEVSVNGTEEESLEVPTDAHAGENIPVHEVHSHSHGHHGGAGHLEESDHHTDPGHLADPVPQEHPEPAAQDPAFPEHASGLHHVHSHAHHGMAEIDHRIEHLDIPEQVKRDVKSIYQIIAEAEASVHGRPVSEIHFHEVGTADALADITGCALLIRELGAEKIVTSPINVGYGQVRCAHGILPVPAPATARILEGVPCYAGRIEGELCTPTGAAILKYYSDEFCRLPQMIIRKMGYGMGKKDFPAANCVRAVLGESI